MRPRSVHLRPRAQFFSIQTDRKPVNNVIFFFRAANVKKLQAKFIEPNTQCEHTIRAVCRKCIHNFFHNSFNELEKGTTPKWRNFTFLPSEITHFCYRRPMFQIQQHRSASDRLTASFAAKPDFMSCPLIGQSSSWRTAVMSPTRVGYTPMSLSLPHSQWGSGATFSQR